MEESVGEMATPIVKAKTMTDAMATKALKIVVDKIDERLALREPALAYEVGRARHGISSQLEVDDWLHANRARCGQSPCFGPPPRLQVMPHARRPVQLILLTWDDKSQLPNINEA